ncbi:protein Wnt-7b-like precursor [Parasteatoda tepidariorum]|uniref:Protein Wnt n=1 Tax=Parasteatoda tepidariorum TaxID=114398 RepID=Q75PH6_PARTP|nr:protein Wnt-7b-like precursor [Parasteatoda tepidariorum]BAD12589.1 Wnt7-2 [Parasteatoda tepidariorum]
MHPCSLTIKNLHFLILIFSIFNFCQHLRVMTTAAAFTASIICSKIPGLTPAQQRLCQERPDLIVAVGDGARMGINECQKRFRHRRWNCTAIGSSYVFGHVVVIGSREAAYTYAVTSAGVTYAITQACSRGTLWHCGCDISKDGMLDPEGGWKWGGCSADVRHGMKMSRQFMDAREIEGDERSLMNLHNNRAGRKAVLFTVQTECKCHGVSGSCTMKTCWLTLPPFSKTGDYLMRRYQIAKRVFAHFGGPAKKTTRKTRPLFLRTKKSKRPHRKPRPRDLVYLEKSPNYCEADPMKGSTGTSGRLCNRTSRGTDGCDLLCCGRGYNTHQFTRTAQCRCKFHWCCYVDCRVCTERTEVYSCK